MDLKKGTYLVLFLFLYSCSNSTSVEEKRKDVVLTSEETSSLFLIRCASCHGQDGKLGVSGAKDLSITLLDSVQIEQVISNGKGGMPGFGEVLYPNELKALVEKVISLKK
jgi:mono/diheme cytochrome c family protein